MKAPEAIVSLLEPWAQLYSDSSWISTVVVFGHIAALVFAGGLAITLDRGTLRAWNGTTDAKARQLDDLAAAHRLVLRGLALSVATGVLLLTADIETYYGSALYWIKMALVVMLFVNGYRMTSIERRIRTSADSSEAWASLRFTAVTSLALWFMITLAGVALAMAF